jgi:predicted metalloprotease with PDZ domain
LKEISGGSLSLDDVVRQLCEQQTTISLEKLRQTAEKLAGEPLSSLPSDGASY